MLLKEYDAIRVRHRTVREAVLHVLADANTPRTDIPYTPHTAITCNCNPGGPLIHLLFCKFLFAAPTPWLRR